MMHKCVAKMQNEGAGGRDLFLASFLAYLCDRAIAQEN